MYHCKICGADMHSNVKLSIHIRKEQDMSTKMYYDTYVKKCGDEFCVVCGKCAIYKSFVFGYSKTCCRSCSAKNFRNELKNDPIRNQIFVDKVSDNMVKIWEDRAISGEMEVIIEKATKTIRENNKTLTVQERKERFGWLNKLSGEERETKIKEMIKPLQDFYENISEEELVALVKKRTATFMERYGNTYPEYLSEISEDGNMGLCRIFGIQYVPL